MRSPEIEEAFIRQFILPERQERWLYMLASAKQRKKQLHRLNHHFEFRADEIRSLPLHNYDCTEISELLKKEKVGHSVYAISYREEIDGKTFSFEEAIDRDSGCLWRDATVCIFLPGQLAMWTEDSGQSRYLLINKTMRR